jgi:hypothetical protein
MHRRKTRARARERERERETWGERGVIVRIIESNMESG